MTNKFNSRIDRLTSKLCAAAALAGLLALPLHAQYVATALSTNLFEPYGVTTDPGGNVYLTDSSDNRIVKIVPSAGTVTTLAGLTGPSNSGTNNGTGPAARFSQPLGIVYARGGLVVVDQGNQLIRYVTLNGAVSNLAGVPGVYGENNGPANAATFSFPTGIAVDNGGNLYIADQGNNAIRMISAVDNSVSTLAVGSYHFNLPAAVAVDNNSNVWVTDTGNQVICMISNGAVSVMAGMPKVSGTNDSLIATQAQFNHPSGLLWITVDNSLLISDTGNDTIRHLFLTNALGPESYAVQTVAGMPGQAGEVNGAPTAAEFNGPTGLAVDVPDSGYFVVDRAGNALRVVQTTQPQPPVPSPSIGYVTFPLVLGVPSATFNNITGTTAVFNNVVDIAIQADPTVETFFNFGPTPVNPLHNTIATPGPGTGSPVIFTSADNQAPPSQVPPSVLNPAPDVTLYAVSEAPGRQSSPVVNARIEFVTANPIINGNNAAAVSFSDGTSNAVIYYTIDGTNPVIGAVDTFGPVLPGQAFGFAIVSNATLTAQAFFNGFAPSGVVSEQFSATNFSADQITWGFQGGEGSAEFVAAAGQTFCAPVTMTLIPTAEVMYSLQFNLAITNLSPAPSEGPFSFLSMLAEPLAGTNPQEYTNIAPSFVSGGSGQGLVLTNDTLGLLEVGWLEEAGTQNLYPSASQTLISYSQAHDTVFTNTSGEVIVGAFSFRVPSAAVKSNQYEIQIGSPSGTSDGIADPVFIEVVTNGSLAQGAINSIKKVTINSSSPKYLVGDVAPFRWFNAGDFGDTNLVNADVTETFQSAVYHWRIPATNTDYFNAMDSSDGSDNNLYDGSDPEINSIAMGDGALAVDDVYVTYRRSLDPSLTNYVRYWTNGALASMAVPSTLTKPFAAQSVSHAPHSLSGGSHTITVAPDQVIAGGNFSVSVPVRVLAADILPLRVFMFNVEVDPLDGSPPITTPVTFSPATALGSATIPPASTGPNNYAAAWLNSTNAGISGTNIIGLLNVTLPPNATTNCSYRIHFAHFSASPNGLALFHATVGDGLITMGDRSGSSWHDGIPDAWRLLYFGTVSNALSAANVDSDGDGASNWAEYV